MRQAVQNALNYLIREYCAEKSLPFIWQKPLVKYASGDSPVIHGLKSLVIQEHIMPEDFLPGARSILSYYLPFREEVGNSNTGGEISSPLWAQAYINTNRMAVEINLRLVDFIKENGYDAVSPGNPGRVRPDIHFSNWSQRHIAYAAGHGSFGLNNMLITEKGCCGRFFSVVTSLPYGDEVVTAERCLYKINGKCRLCTIKCLNGALSIEGFDRKKCSLMGSRNAELYSGATVCGKCVAGMPCAFKIP